MTGLADAGGPRLDINLGHLVANWEECRRQSGGAATSAVIKADAYGIGATRAAQALALAGCETFFVATLAEAVDVRQVAGSAAIYVLNGPYGDLSDYLEFDIRPVISSLEMLDHWQHAGSLAHRKLPIAVHIDTGMNRLGLSPDEWQSPAVQTRLKDLPLAMVMSHLACADEAAHPLSARQAALFDQLTDASQMRSLANSAGIFLDPRYQYDLTRPGIALHGAAIGDVHPPLKPVVTATSSVLATRTVRAGESVSYGSTYEFDVSTPVAVVEVGYADGYLRSGSSQGQDCRAHIWINEHRAPVLGRVTMDLTIVDITGIPDVAAGTPVELFGANLPIDELALATGTNTYELLTRMGPRFTRTYHNPGD